MAESQLEELRAIRSQNSQIIALLQKKFDFPPDLSDNLPELSNKLEITEQDKQIAADFLATILPCGAPLIEVNASDGRDPQPGFIEPKEGNKWVVQNNLQRALESLKNSMLHAPSRFPRVVENGSTIEISDAGDFMKLIASTARRLESNAWNIGFSSRDGYAWHIKAVLPGDYGQHYTPYKLEDISSPSRPKPFLQKEDFIDSSMNKGGMICLLAVDPSQDVIDFDTAAAVVSLSHLTYDNFLLSHFGQWQDQSFPWILGHGPYRPFRYQIDEDRRKKISHYSYFMKSFTITAFDDSDEKVKKTDEESEAFVNENRQRTGFKIERDCLSISESPEKHFELRETRYSTHLVMKMASQSLRNFELFSIVDGRDQAHSGGLWFLAKIRPLMGFTGMAAFQLEILGFIRRWDADWRKTLDKLEAAVSVKLASLNDKDNLDSILYDPQLKNTKLYFKVLQVLRMASDNIRSSKLALELFALMAVNDFMVDIDDGKEELNEVLNHNWNVVKSRLEGASKDLMTRITRLEEEVKSLRDGLFNAQSVREAQKSRDLNKVLMVFTIVTIIFLPLTFAATLFSLEFFQASTNSESRERFWTVAALITSITLLLSLAAIWGVMLPEPSRRRLTNWYLSLRDKLMQLNGVGGSRGSAPA